MVEVGNPRPYVEYAKDPERYISYLATDLTVQTLNILDYVADSADPIFFNPDDVISEGRMAQVASFAARDISRSNADQNAMMSISKYVGYIAYWFVRIKPIINVKYQKITEKHDLLDVNERVALVLMEFLLASVVRKHPDLQPPHWKVCNNGYCHRRKKPLGTCFFDGIYNFFNHGEEENLNYVVFSQVDGPPSPHLFALLVDQALFYTCGTVSGLESSDAGVESGI
jgi:hypothetical protein